MEILVLQHIACEPPGVFEDVLVERGATIHRVELDEGEPLPERRDFDAVIAMGGPMSVNDEDEHPWLRDEKRLVAETVRAGTPFWGVCLGVQLLAVEPRRPRLPRRRARGRPPPRRDHTGRSRRPGVRRRARRAGDAAVARRHVRPARRRRAARRLTRLSQPGVPRRPRLRRAVPPRGDAGDGARMGRGARVREPRSSARSAPAPRPASSPGSRQARRRDARARPSALRALARRVVAAP